jgi:hypothetical protein
MRRLKKYLADAFLYLLAAALLLWLADWTVWRIRVSHGGGYDNVQVNQILLTPLKNHRMKADEQSTASQPCTRSIFPHGGDDACWWLRRHATDFQNASLTDHLTRVFAERNAHCPICRAIRTHAPLLRGITRSRERS